MRSRLVAGAIRLVDEHGAEGLQVRKLAAAVGTSTMAVYTHFSGMPGIVTAVRTEGHRRLAATMLGVEATADPIADLVTSALAYRQTAVDSPHLFALTFGHGAPSRTAGAAEPADLVTALRVIVGQVRRAMEAGRLLPGLAEPVADQVWAAQHGVVVLEAAGRFVASPDHAPNYAPDYAVDSVLVPQMVALAVGLGDDRAAATRSAEIGLRAWEQRPHGTGRVEPSSVSST